MKMFRGHSFPDDLYYLIISYIDKEGYKNPQLYDGYDDRGFPIKKQTLTKDVMETIVNDAIEYNIKQIIYN